MTVYAVCSPPAWGSASPSVPRQVGERSRAHARCPVDHVRGHRGAGRLVRGANGSRGRARAASGVAESPEAWIKARDPWDVGDAWTRTRRTFSQLLRCSKVQLRLMRFMRWMGSGIPCQWSLDEGMKPWIPSSSDHSTGRGATHSARKAATRSFGRPMIARSPLISTGRCIRRGCSTRTATTWSAVATSESVRPWALK